jgi:hypothetical protein
MRFEIRHISERSLRNARVCYIADLVAESEKYLHSLVKKVVESCQHEGIDMINYSLLENGRYLQALRKHGFIPFPFLRDHYLGVYSRSTKYSRAFLQNPQNWFFQHADTDLI